MSIRKQSCGIALHPSPSIEMLREASHILSPLSNGVLFHGLGTHKHLARNGEFVTFYMIPTLSG